MTRREERIIWQKRVKDFEENGKGQSLAAWCRANSYKAKQFGRWRRRISDEKPNDSKKPIQKPTSETVTEKPSKNIFIPVTINSIEKTTPICIRIGKAAIEINSGYKRDMLAEILKITSEIC